MKKWKAIKIITLLILIVFIGFLIKDLVACISYHYPFPMMGVEANNFWEAFMLDLGIYLFALWPFLLIDIILLVISIKKIKKYNYNENK